MEFGTDVKPLRMASVVLQVVFVNVVVKHTCNNMAVS
jgi:hypothetical protein